MSAPTHRNLKKMTARYAGSCRRSPCSNRIAVGDAIYFSNEHGAYCQACGAEEAQRRSAFAASRSSDRARRVRERKDGERVLDHVRRHGALPAWWVETRPSASEAAMWLPSFTKQAAAWSLSDALEPCGCVMCKEPAGVGDEVRVRRGAVGDGFAFTVVEVGRGELVVYGRDLSGCTYGPRRASEVEVVRRAAAGRS